MGISFPEIDREKYNALEGMVDYFRIWVKLIEEDPVELTNEDFKKRLLDFTDIMVLGADPYDPERVVARDFRDAVSFKKLGTAYMCLRYLVNDPLTSYLEEFKDIQQSLESATEKKDYEAKKQALERRERVFPGYQIYNSLAKKLIDIKDSKPIKDAIEKERDELRILLAFSASSFERQ